MKEEEREFAIKYFPENARRKEKSTQDACIASSRCTRCRNKNWHRLRPKWRLSPPPPRSREKAHCRGASRDTGLHFNAFPYSRARTHAAFCTSWIYTRGVMAVGEVCAAGWLTCRFIDEFGRTFVRRDFNTIEGFRHCCSRGASSTGYASTEKDSALDSLFGILMIPGVSSICAP